MSRASSQDWRVVLLAIGSGGAGLLALSSAAAITSFDVFEAWSAGAGSVDSLALPPIAAALGLTGVVMLVASFHAMRVWSGQNNPAMMVQPVSLRLLALLLPLWVGSSMLAPMLLGRGLLRWFAPLLFVLAIATPIYLLLKTAAGRIVGGSRLRLFGALAAGIVLSTGLAAAAEVMLLLLGVAVSVAYVILHPELLPQLQHLVTQLEQVRGADQAFDILGPILVNPIVVITALAIVSGAVPVIEEFAKSAACWAILDRIMTPAQGFWVGASSGAGFALFEGLMASSEITEGWAAVLLIRGGSSMMHILASGLVGWGIGAFRIRRQLGPLAAGYLSAMGLHAAWNGAVVALAYGGMRTFQNPASPGLMAVTSLAIGTLLLGGLLSTVPIALIVINQRLAKQAIGLEPGDPIPAPPAATFSMDQ